MEELVELAKTQGPLVTVLIIIIVTVVRGDWIPKKSHDRELELTTKHYESRLQQEREDKEEWKQIALRVLDTAETSAEVGKIALDRQQRR